MNYCNVQQHQCDTEIKIDTIEDHISTYIEVKVKQNQTRVKRQDRLGKEAVTGRQHTWVF